MSAPDLTTDLALALTDRWMDLRGCGQGSKAYFHAAEDVERVLMLNLPAVINAVREAAGLPAIVEPAQQMVTTDDTHKEGDE